MIPPRHGETTAEESGSRVETVDPLEDDQHGHQGAAVGAPYSEPSTFQPGQVLQERFKILRFIARGGAGEVYEAQDLELRLPVALKVARPEISHNENAIERFRREIALARQVTHPNVCRIFDVFRLELQPAYPGGEPRQTLFLTMELLNGESLASRIHRLGPLTPEEALPLIEGMVSGLTAAHRVGVVHRDFKSANVVLVEEPEGKRAVITDFGLARGHLPELEKQDITMSGTVVGTPNYMSPEQLTGGTITPLVDTYALGIVMFEMMTATRPFKGNSDLSTAVKRLTEAPPSPRIHVPELEESWERTILRCLERDPVDRFPRLTDIPKALRGQVTTEIPASIRRKKRGQYAWVAAVLVPVIVALGLLFSVFPGSAGTVQLGIGEMKTPRVTMMEFVNLSHRPESNWLRAALPEMIAGEMAEGGGVQMTSREVVDSVIDDLELINESNLSEETLERVRTQSGADLVMEGAFLELSSGMLRLQIRVHDPQGATVTITETGTEDELFDLVGQVSRRLRDRLEISSAPQNRRRSFLWLPGRDEADTSEATDSEPTS